MKQRSTLLRDRKIKNFAIAPDKQFRLAFILICAGLFVFLAFFGFELWLLSSVISNLTPLAPPDSELHALVAQSIWWSWAAFALISIIFSLLVLLGTLVISHRFFGPVFALRKHIEALLKGEYSHRTHLRKSDELKELAADLNQLSEKLENGVTS